jgi:hypothetical protein
MSADTTLPKIGEGATKLSWSDRSAYTVIEVSADGLSCKIQRDKAIRTDNYGMSDAQDYRYEQDENGQVIELVFRRGKWRQISKSTIFTKEFDAWIEHNKTEWIKLRDGGRNSELWDEHGDLKLVKGKTKIQTTYPEFPVIFGRRDEYYDYSF